MNTRLRSSKKDEGYSELDDPFWRLFGIDILSNQTSTDANGNLTGFTHITTSTDANGNTYSWTNHYDANWNLTQSAYSDSAGNTSVTHYQNSTDANGNLTGFTHITTSTDANGNTYSWTNHYDANWKLTESAYSDSAGNTSLTHYQNSTDANGNLTGFTHITTSTDANGNTYSWTNHYDANWNLTQSAYSDSAGNHSNTQYLDRTDVDGNITGFTHITTSTDANGNTYSWTNHYDTNWKLTESAYSDSTGIQSYTQYLDRTDVDGNITGFTHITTSTDAIGNFYSWTNHYDTNWKLTESAYADNAGNQSNTQYLDRTDVDGNITGFTHITTSTDANGNSYSWTNHYDANWNLTESAYSDSTGNQSYTQYLDRTDVDGNATVFNCIDLSDQNFEKLAIDENLFSGSPSFESIIPEAAWGTDTLTFCRVADYLIEDATISAAVVGVVSFTSLPQNDFLIT